MNSLRHFIPLGHCQACGIWIKKKKQLLGSGDRMTSFKMFLSVHSCLDVQEGEGNVKHPGKQWPIVEI